MKKYLHLATVVRNQIEQRQLRPGETLVSIRHMAENMSVSKNTVIRAYMQLEDEGLIEPQNRSGFTVCYPKTALPQQTPEPREVRLGKTALTVIRAASDPKAIPLGSAHPNIQFPACKKLYQLIAQSAARQQHSDIIGGCYTTPPGLAELRQQVARQLSAAHKPINPDDILITNGAMEAISLSLLSIATAGDIIAVEKPAYYGNLNCIEALGMKVLEIPCQPEQGMDLTILEQALSKWPVKALLTNPSFQNPMGFSMPLHNRTQLLELAKRHAIPVIEDDTFGELYHDNQPIASLLQLDQYENVIGCGSLSKTVDSDIRIGWAISHKYIDQLTYMKYVSSLASPGITQQAVAKFLTGNQYQRHLRRVRRHYKQAKEQILALIYQHWPKSVQVTQPNGGFLLWCSLPDAIDGDQIFQQAQQLGINTAPGSLFSSGREFSNCIRLNYACWQPNQAFSSAVITLGKLISHAIDVAPEKNVI